MLWPGQIQTKNKVKLLGIGRMKHPRATSDKKVNMIINQKDAKYIFPHDFLNKECGDHDDKMYFHYYMKANNINDFEDVDDKIYKAWVYGDTKLQEEKTRLIDVSKLNKQRQKEAEEFQKENEEYKKRLEKSIKKWGKTGAYDGRRKTNGKNIGHELKVGKRIMFENIKIFHTNKNYAKYVTATIIKILPGYLVELNHVNAVKIDTDAYIDLNTEVCDPDDNQKQMYALKECLLVPGEVQNLNDFDEGFLKIRNNFKGKQSKFGSLFR